jgi:hypothetical protein
LYTKAGESLLGDFGAACFFDPTSVATAEALQRLEVRAFGCLLEELLAHCPEVAAAPATHQAWQALVQRCMQPETGARPLFVEIQRVLTELAAAGPQPVVAG